MATPLGVHSPKLDAVRALRTKAGRSAQNRYVVEGPSLLAEAVAAGLEPEAIYGTEAGLARLADSFARFADRTFLVPERALARLSDLETPPGLLAVLPLALETLAAVLQDGQPALVLAGIADPGNAGTLLRAAEIFGLRSAIFGAGGVEPLAPKVVRAAMGATFRLRLATATPDELPAAARRAGYTLVAAARGGTPLPDFIFPPRPLIAIGNERRGVAGWLAQADCAVSIPQLGAGESLNAAVAGAIILYTYSRQRAAAAEGNESGWKR